MKHSLHALQSGRRIQVALFPMVQDRIIRYVSMVLLFLLLSGTLIVFSPALLQHAHAQSSATISVDANTTYQTIDGFGTALVGVGNLYAMNSTPQQQILDLLFGQGGAGLNIVRFELGNGDFYGSPGFTIEPTSPGSPTATPNYVWDHSADHVVWALQQAKQRGVAQLYGDAWSAPAFMKTNNDPGNGGDLCGEASCSSGDWRQAYANYLVQYLKDYQSEGLTIDNVDFVNEVEAQVNYESMTLTAPQLADFIKVLGPTIQNANLPTRIACCDDSAMNPDIMNPILADSTAASYLKVATFHAYGGSPAAYPNAQAAGIPTWMSEHACGWTPGTETYLTGPCSGQNKSDEIYADLTNGLSAYFDWTGVGGPNYGLDLIEITDSNSYAVSSQFWATANYSRYIHAGAVRIGTSSTDGNMYVTSYKNTNGSYVVVVDNHESPPLSTTINIPALSSGMATPYVTDNSGGMQQQSTLSISNGSLTTNMAPNATTTFTITGQGSSQGGFSGRYYLVNQNSNKCLGISGNSTTNNAYSDQYDCVTAPSQYWSLQQQSNGSYYIVNQNSNKCLGISANSTANGAQADQYDCVTAPSQYWSLQQQSNGSYYIINQNSNKCLSISANSTDNNANTNQWDCVGAPSQYWSFQQQ